MGRRVRLWVLAAACVAALSLPAAAESAVRPFGKLACVPAEGVRFCEGSVANRIPTWDGVPLDVNVTLPAKRSRGLPLVIQLHGWGGSKSGLGASKEWAEDGYAVLNYSARGFGDSCGSAASRAAAPSACAKGWVHLGDSRYEARDSQYLAGLLADQGIVAPRRIGVTGASYGGGQSLALATLRNRVRLRSGRYVTWRSPRGRRMEIAAAAPQVPWSDLVASLTPNGGTLDTEVTGLTDDLFPVGIMKQSYQTGLYVSGMGSGYYAPKGADPSADLTGWYEAESAGEPYDSKPYIRNLAREIARNHSPYYLKMSVPPAPTLISNGFTDDLFPADEAVRYANKVFAKYPRARIAQLHFDYGHPRGQSKAADVALLSRRTHAWFDHYVKGRRVRVLRGVEALTQTCPSDAPSGGPYRARTWDALSPGEVRYYAPRAQTVLSSSGSQAVSGAIDPITGQGACAAPPAADEAGTATYRLPAAGGRGYTLLGSPAVSARFAVSGRHPALAMRLWDVAPGGATQQLVARGLLRPRKGSRQVFQLHPNGWRFRAGHVPKLELVGRDTPYGRPSNFEWSIRVSDLRLRLPVHEKPGGAVKRPLRAFRRP
ncbi:MAG: acetylxylan esterase [Thermoleophilaceae bacterium]|nr:acetylxylan esterase [Thermoleophilaceae bacterium]